MVRRKVIQQQENMALEVINPGASEDLEEGSVILVRTELTIGRREDNSNSFIRAICIRSSC